MYLLDTNVLSGLMRRTPDFNVEFQFESKAGALFTSSVCIEEIRYGTQIAPPENRLWERLEANLLPYLEVISFDESVALIAGDLRANWKLRGTPIGYRDGLIAATAKAHGMTVVTRNVRHFDHVTGLKIENWFDPTHR